MSDPIRWDVSMTQDGIGRFVSYHDYAMKSEECEALRARVAELEESVSDALNGRLHTEDEKARMIDSLMEMIGRISDALGISHEEQSAASGDEEILHEIAELKAALAKRETVPEGFVLVPKEPTDEMLMEGCDAMQENHETANYGMCCGCTFKETRAAYTAMLSAAQKGRNP